jgi:hypothetical protein
MTLEFLPADLSPRTLAAPLKIHQEKRSRAQRGLPFCHSAAVIIRGVSERVFSKALS